MYDVCMYVCIYRWMDVCMYGTILAQKPKMLSIQFKKKYILTVQSRALEVFFKIFSIIKNDYLHFFFIKVI